MIIDDIDVNKVRNIEDKISLAMCRLNSLRKWKCEFKFYGLKDRMIQKLRWQIDFLVRVNKVKFANAIN